MRTSNLRQGAVLTLQPAALRHAVGDLPAGTRGLYNWFENGLSEFCPTDAEGMLIGDVWYTVHDRNLSLKED